MYRSTPHLLVLYASAAWCTLLLLGSYAPLFGGTVSRRACNLGYIVWTLALNSSALALCRWLWDATGHNSHQGLLSACSAAQMLVFLVANVLTGLVNMMVDTLAVSDWPARALVCAYGMLVAAVALCLGRGTRLARAAGTRE